MSLIKYRVHEVAKDFGVNSKVIAEILTKYATKPATHQKVLEDAEVSIIFEYMTQHNQVESIESIFADVYHEPKPAEPKAPEKAAPAPAAKGQEKAASKAQAGAQQQGGGFLAGDVREAAGRDAALRTRKAGAEAALWQAGRDRRQHRFHAGQRDDAGPGAQGTLHGQRGRAPVAGAARHHQHRPKAALMAIPCPGRDVDPDGFRCDGRSHGHTSP